MQTILLVEDNLDLRVLLRTVLAYEFPTAALQEAATGRAFLTLLDQQQPRLVVLDVHLPDASGLSLYHLLRLRPNLQEVPVLFVTANPGLVRAAALVGQYACLAKPFDLAVLVTHVRALLAPLDPSKAGGAKDGLIGSACEQSATAHRRGWHGP
jgi:DNA-binding response OmpR family regulator